MEKVLHTNLLQEETFVNHMILLSEEILVIVSTTGDIQKIYGSKNVWL